MSEASVPVETRRERKRRELRQRVYDCARELFRKQGFAATTVEQIAAEADIAPATFFNHFQNKQTLLGVMTSEVVTFLELLMDEHLAEDRPIAAQLVGLAVAAADLIAENHLIARDVVLETVRAEASPHDTAPYLARVHDPVARAIRTAQQRGELRSEPDAVFLAQMVLGMLNATITQWLSDPDYPIAEQLPRAAAFASEALRAPIPSD